MLSSKTIRVTKALMEDYENQQSHFEDVESSILPVESVMDQMGFSNDRERALYLTLSTALNFMRSAETLRRKTKALWDKERWIYEPDTLVGEDRYGELESLFTRPVEYTDSEGQETESKMRYGKKDCDIWFTIATTLYEDHESNPLDFFASHDYDASEIFAYVQTERRDEYAHERITFSKQKFPYLAGEKIGPLWLRLVDDLVRPLDGVDLLPLPVDRQIVKVTNYLEGTNYSLEPSAQDRKEIRKLWEPFCEQHGYSTAELDDALWRIGEEENWDNWGQEYLDDLLSEA